MAEPDTISAWILLFFGLYSLSAGLGEFRQPGFWKSMIDDFATTPSLRFLTGIFCLVLGAAIYLSNPWDSSDWMSILVTVLGGWVVIEGIAFLILGDRFVAISAVMMGSANRLWAVLASVLGLVMIVAAVMRL